MINKLTKIQNYIHTEYKGLEATLKLLQQKKRWNNLDNAFLNSNNNNNNDINNNNSNDNNINNNDIMIIRRRRKRRIKQRNTKTKDTNNKY